MFTEKLVAALRRYSSAERYLVGVSGGRDSVALLHGLAAAGFRRLVVCHLDHGLRGRAARADARFVERLAGKMGLPVESGRVDVAALAAREKLSLETAAREARYRFFAGVAGKHRCRRLLLAHQADDQVETFLFNLLRGAGPAGLAAMAVESKRAVGRRTLRIIRPLLAVWRTEIDAFLQEQGLPWREDASNADATLATRNRLRHEILPYLAKAAGREIKPTLWRTADILGAEEAWLDSLCAAQPPPPEQLAVETLRSQPLAQRRRTVRRWLAARGIGQIGFHEIEAVLSLLDPTTGLAKVNLPGDRHVRRRVGFIFVDGLASKRRLGIK